MHILSLKVFKEFKYILVRLWNDEMCSISQGFVCKKPREGTWTTQPSTPFPKGNADIIAIMKILQGTAPRTGWSSRGAATSFMVEVDTIYQKNNIYIYFLFFCFAM